MGVVRDVTVDNLVTAVGNIDTSSLAQDSTLQDVVTAIGNISGGSDPVTNTTVNSLCKDSTGQSIASAISGLGAALGSDKANISGDNIASPSTFRGAINVTSSFSYYNETTGTTPLALPDNWKLLIAQVVYNGVYLTTIFTNGMMTTSGNAVSLGNYGTSYAIGQIAKREFKIMSVNWAGSNVTASSKAFIYLAY